MASRNLIFVLLVMLVIALLYPPLVGAQDDKAALGKKIFDAKCWLCHGMDGKGDGPAAAGLDPAPSDLTKPSFWNKGTDQIITKTLHNGKSDMPAFNFSDSELQELIAYLTKAFKPK